MFNVMKFKFVILLLLAGKFLFSSDNIIEKKWNLNLGYTQFPGIINPTNILGAELNYCLMKYIDFGGGLNYGKYLGFERPSFENNFLATNGQVDVNGVGLIADIRVHILPFVLKESQFPFDLYLISRLGGIKYLSSAKYYPSGFKVLYGAYAGLNITFLSYAGIFAEYGKGNFSDWRLGLNFKF